MENLWHDENEIREQWNEAFPPPMLLGQNQERVADYWLTERREAMEKMLIKLIAEFHTTKYPTDDGVEAMRIVRHILKDYLLTLQEAKPL